MGNHSRSLLGYVKAYYSNPDRIKSYMDVNLWPSEEVVTRRYFETGSTILDIGCGAGRTSIALAKMGYQVTGIDFIPEMIHTAKRQAQEYGQTVDFEVMDAVKMTFPGESFDNAFFSFNGFEHIPGKRNREKVLKDVFIILKPGGCFILTARSGLAVGRRSAGWVWMCMAYPFQKCSKGNGKERELGDKLWKGEFHHYLSPFYVKNLVTEIGFKILYFNSYKNIVKEKRPSFFTNFSNDKSLFYVLKKNSYY